jgi:hypothetical protein
VFKTRALFPAWKNPKLKRTRLKLIMYVKNLKSPNPIVPKNLVIIMLDTIDKGINITFTEYKETTCLKRGLF